MKKIFIIAGVLVLIILGVGIYKFNFTNNDIYLDNGEQINSHDGTYIIGGQSVTLKNGISEIDVTPGSASKIVTKYFGNDFKYDLNQDGRKDNIFILTQNTGGSGTFYYVVALLDIVDGFIGSDGVLLGDRIVPQSIEMNEEKTSNGIARQNVVVVNYLDRKDEESFNIAPSVEKSIWLKLDPNTMQFGFVEQDFEGESNIPEMTLNMKKWGWVKTLYNDGKLITPLNKDKFSISFDKKTFSATTDCNSIGGEYLVKDNTITFDKMMSTKMYCVDSQESDFTKMLSETQSFLFTSKGELVFTMEYDSGSVFFK